MTFRWFLSLLLFAGLLLADPPLPGEPINAPVAKGSPITVLDLLRLICSDLAVDGDAGVKAVATKAIAIREVGAKESPVEAEGEIVVESVKTFAQLKTRLLLSFIMNARDDVPESLYLAVFDLGAVPRLVDVVSIPGFPDDAGGYDSTLKLSETTDAYVFASYHSNSSQGYADYWIVFVHGDHIERITDVGILSSPYGDVQGFEEEVKFSTIPEPGHVNRSVVIKATLKYLPDDPKSEHRPLRRGYSRLYSATYRWDAKAGKFVTLSKEIQALEAFNGRKY